MTPVLYRTPVPQPVGLSRGYGHKQKTDKSLTILRIVSTLSKGPYTYTQLRQVTKIHRNILRRRLEELISKEIVMRSKEEYSFQNKGNGKNNVYYTLNVSHPIVKIVLNKKESKVDITRQISNYFFKNGSKEEEPRLPITRMSLVQPPQDHEHNCISKQFEYLIEDIKDFIENFVKRYYPPERERPYYARSVWWLRQFFKQYGSNRNYRDLYDWSEIYLANKGSHPSGKSAKELSSRYGEKIRGYNKQTGEPIFGRKGISKRHIQRKSKDMVKYFQEFYKLMPLFFLMHILFKNKKEKMIVDHLLDRKQSKDIRKR